MTFIYRIQRNLAPVKNLSRLVQLSAMLPMLSYQESMACFQKLQRVEFVHQYNDPFITLLRGNGFDVSTHYIWVRPEQVVTMTIEQVPLMNDLPLYGDFMTLFRNMNPLVSDSRACFLMNNGGSFLCSNFEKAHKLYRVLSSLGYFVRIDTAKVSV